MSFASISITRRRTSWTPTIRRGANSSRAKFRLSTSNLHRRFARAGQSMEVQVMAAVPDANFAARHEADAGAYKIHAELRLQPGAERRRFPLCPGSDRRSSATKKSRAIDPEARRGRGLVERHADQARNGFHHQTEARANAGGRERQPRHGGEGAGLSARPGGHPRLSRGLGPAFPSRACDDDHRDRNARLYHAGLADRN